MAHQEGYYRATEALSFPRLGDLVRGGGDSLRRWLSSQHRVTRRVMVGAILTLALLAFELFNYDTTEFALEDLLGAISFGNVRWATILAIAFCSIDFAGLAQLIAPDRGGGVAPDSRFVRPSWLLLGAWVLGGGMNAIMTWWAVSLALMRHNLGNEVLTREELIRLVPIFVAVLVWITRILLISSFSMTASQSPVRSGGSTERRRPGRSFRSKRWAGATSAPRPALLREQPLRSNGPSLPAVPGKRPSRAPVKMRGRSAGSRAKVD